MGEKKIFKMILFLFLLLEYKIDISLYFVKKKKKDCIEDFLKWVLYNEIEIKNGFFKYIYFLRII